MCLSAARFDGFFGNARFDDEYEATCGSVVLGALWDERDRLDPSLRFKLRLRLPQLDERFNAFIGRVDPDEQVTELRDDFDSLPRQFGRQEDDAVLFGLGYSQPGRGGGHFDADVGTELGLPMDPYVKGRYRLALPFLERHVLRLRETIFWQDSEDIGATTRVDLERLLGEKLLVRWTGSGTLTQNTAGVRCSSAARPTLAWAPGSRCFSASERVISCGKLRGRRQTSHAHRATAESIVSATCRPRPDYCCR